MVAIVDYSAGNLASVKKAFDHLNADAVVTNDPDVVAKADKVVLPGVGHFSTTENLKRNGLREIILMRIARGTPFLGICVGMQWMFAGSAEAAETPGSAMLPGSCQHFPKTVKSPHVGWNSIVSTAFSRLLHGVPEDAFVYFTHSYWAPIVSATVSKSEYGIPFSAAVERDNLFGVQFHPEKSGAVGLQILKNFCRLEC
jgi:glutamine amidotransferase